MMPRLSEWMWRRESVAKTSTELAMGSSGKLEFAQKSWVFSAKQLLRWLIAPPRIPCHLATKEPPAFSYLARVKLSIAYTCCVSAAAPLSGFSRLINSQVYSLKLLYRRELRFRFCLCLGGARLKLRSASKVTSALVNFMSVSRLPANEPITVSF